MPNPPTEQQELVLRQLRDAVPQVEWDIAVSDLDPMAWLISWQARLAGDDYGKSYTANADQAARNWRFFGGAAQTAITRIEARTGLRFAVS